MIDAKLFNIKRKEVKKYKRIKRKLLDNFNLSELDMEIIDPEIAIQYISTHHYSKTCTRSIQIAFGFYYDETLVGCIVYANPVGMNVAKSVSTNDEIDTENIWELTRLFMEDFLPNNVESYCISKTIKYIKSECDWVKYLVSYADTSFGHCGIIYQATNWLYCGKIERKAMFEYKGRLYHMRTMYDKFGSSSIQFLKEKLGPELKVKYSNSKNRYVYVLGQSKVEHKRLLSELKYEILPYPKADIKYYRLQ